MPTTDWTVLVYRHLQSLRGDLPKTAGNAPAIGTPISGGRVCAVRFSETNLKRLGD